MNEALNNLLTRRSVRKYKPDMIDDGILNQIIEAGLYAASGKGLQSTIIIAIKDKETRDKLSKLNAVVGGFKEGTDPFYGAPVVLVVLAKKNSVTPVYDGSCTIQNLMNAAHSLGVGSCWVHRAKQEFEQPEWKALLTKLGIEEEYEGIGHCILGYAQGEEPKPAPRKEGRVFII